MSINLSTLKENTTTKYKRILNELDSIEQKVLSINLQEYKLIELSKKTDSLITLSNKIKFENEKTNDTMIKQYDNLQHIDFLIQEEIDIITQLSTDIHTYKLTLDKNIENFKSNKEKLLKIVNFIKEIKSYIFNLKDSSNSMLSNSNNILNISQTIKRISDNSKALSINAQIESAKISRNHIGFNVLSEEMARMATNTKENSILIDDTINTIIKDIDTLNNDITDNVNKIEESIVLCNIIVDFVQALNKEYSSNIMMFDRILDSINEIMLFIDNIKKSMIESHYISKNVFKNTSSEYICIEGLLEESYICKNRTDSIKARDFNSTYALEDDTLKILINYYRNFINNPLDTAYDEEKMICLNVFNTLFSESESGTPIPSLAKGWTDEDSKIWTIYLKNDIYFSNGDPVTAEDIEFSLMRTFVENSYSQPYTLDILEGHKIFKTYDSILNEKISGIQIINDKTIRFKLKQEDVLFPSKLSSNLCLITSKKEYIKTKKSIGTGAYYIDSIHKLNSDKCIINLKANPYNKLANVYIKNIELTMDKNFKLYLENLIKNPKDNIYDIITPIPHSVALKLTEIQDDFKFKVLSENSYSLLLVNFIGISKNNLVKNKDFRQSVFSIIKNIDLDSKEAKDYYIPTNVLLTKWYNSVQTPPEWLDNEPILNKFEEDSFLNIITYASPLCKNICEKIQRSLAEKGIQSKIHILDDYENLEEYDLSVGVFSIDTSNIYSQLYDSISPPYGSCLTDSPIGLKLKESNEITNYKTKNNKLQKLELELLEEYYNLPLCYIKRYSFQNNIINLNTNHALNLKFENIIKKSSKQ